MGVSTNCIVSAMVINQHCLLITRICKFAHIHLSNIIAPASSLSLNPPRPAFYQFHQKGTLVWSSQVDKIMNSKFEGQVKSSWEICLWEIPIPFGVEKLIGKFPFPF